MKKSIVGTYLGLLAIFTMCISYSSGIYSNFLRSHGLSEIETNLVNVSFFLTIFLFEIPTGIYADVFGRKKSFVISCFLISAGGFVYSQVNSMTGFIVAEIISAIGITFYSGAFQAWFIDRLKHYGYKEKLTKIFALEGIVRASASIVVSVIGGKLADADYSLPWLADSVTGLVTGILAMIFMKEEYLVKKDSSWYESLVKVKRTTKNSWRYMRTDKAFRFILIIGFALSFTVMAPNMQWAKIFKDHLGTNYNTSLVMIGIQLMIMLGVYASRWFLPLFKGDEQKAIAICQILIGLTMILTVLSGNLMSMTTFFLIHEVFRGLFRPIKDAYLHEMLPKAERATLTSFESMYGHLGGAIGLVTSGLIATYCGIPTAWLVTGSILILITLVLKNRRLKQ